MKTKAEADLWLEETVSTVAGGEDLIRLRRLLYQFGYGLFTTTFDAG